MNTFLAYLAAIVVGRGAVTTLGAASPSQDAELSR
jgi:hypothetical protein